jgi:flavodoxin I
MATAIFYASSTGNTSNVGKIISDQLGGISKFDLSFSGAAKIDEYDKVILGASTWGEGELQDDWEEAWDEFCDLDFSGKTVALYGLGDQEGYGDEFVDAMGIIYDQVIAKGAKVVGNWPVDGYDFESSNAVRDGSFVGLAIDEDNQDDMTEERIAAWCEDIKRSIL